MDSNIISRTIEILETDPDFFVPVKKLWLMLQGEGLALNFGRRPLWLLDEPLLPERPHLVSDGGSGYVKGPAVQDVMRTNRTRRFNELVDNRRQKPALPLIHRSDYSTLRGRVLGT